MDFAVMLAGVDPVIWLMLLIWIDESEKMMQEIDRRVRERSKRHK